MDQKNPWPKKNIYFYKSNDVILDLMVFLAYYQVKNSFLPGFMAYIKSLTSIKYDHSQIIVC